jgi:hypothetical protein
MLAPHSLAIIGASSKQDSQALIDRPEIHEIKIYSLRASTYGVVALDDDRHLRSVASFCNKP